MFSINVLLILVHVTQSGRAAMANQTISTLFGLGPLELPPIMSPNFDAIKSVTLGFSRPRPLLPADLGLITLYKFQLHTNYKYQLHLKNINSHYKILIPIIYSISK